MITLTPHRPFQHITEINGFKRASPITRTGLMNPNFVYTSAANTNIRKTFDRVRAEKAAKC